MRKLIKVNKYRRFKNNRWEDVREHERLIDSLELSQRIMDDIIHGKAKLLIETESPEEYEPTTLDETMDIAMEQNMNNPDFIIDPWTIDVYWDNLTYEERGKMANKIGISRELDMEKFLSYEWDMLPEDVKQDIKSALPTVNVFHQNRIKKLVKTRKEILEEFEKKNLKIKKIEDDIYEKISHVNILEEEIKEFEKLHGSEEASEYFSKHIGKADKTSDDLKDNYDKLIEEGYSESDLISLREKIDEVDEKIYKLELKYKK